MRKQDVKSHPDGVRYILVLKEEEYPHAPAMASPAHLLSYDLGKHLEASATPDIFWRHSESNMSCNELRFETSRSRRGPNKHLR